jgi:hypothetical protein
MSTSKVKRQPKKSGLRIKGEKLTSKDGSGKLWYGLSRISEGLRKLPDGDLELVYGYLSTHSRFLHQQSL